MDGTPHRTHRHRSSTGMVIAIIASASANVGFAVGTIAGVVGELGAYSAASAGAAATATAVLIGFATATFIANG
ncbi:hypothetical protein ABZZ36_43460 [Actinacidiphila glaucinigra]|uniref:hypothetical protein n=1 Tax=Actinacidiphila glaucinigra TaxID=235986 RepID=UPI0033BF843D